MMNKDIHFEASDFKVATVCANCAHCVEVGYKTGVIAVRSSKNPHHEPLYFDKEEWAAFIEGVKKGEFDFS